MIVPQEICNEIDPKTLAVHLVSLFGRKKIEQYLNITPHSAYQDDPVGFGEKVLHDTYTDDVRRLMESVRDHEITVAISANATGKTHAAARVAVWFFLAFEDAQVYTAAAPPEENLKRLLWGQIGEVVESHPGLFESCQIRSLHIQKSANSFLTGVTIPSSGTEHEREAKFSGKHAPHLLFILDEGDAIPDEVYRGIESCMSGGHVRMLVMFNPRQEMGAVYRIVRDGRANVVHLSAFKHINVISGEDRIPGAVTREVTVRRINEWCRKLVDGERVTDECFELPDYLEGAVAQDQAGRQYPPLESGWYRVEDPQFFYMVLGRYPTQSEYQLVSKEWISAARARWDAYVAEFGERPPIGVQPVMGLDIAETLDLNCACFRYGGFVSRLLLWSEPDTTETAEKAAELYRERKALVCNVDGTGVGAGVAPGMRKRGCNAISVKVASTPTISSEEGEFRIVRDQLWWSIREWLRKDSGAMLPPDEKLLEELSVPTYEIRRGKIVVMEKDEMKKMLGRSPDRADSLCLTFYRGAAVYDALDVRKAFNKRKKG
jgi:hypothetical protein